MIPLFFIVVFTFTFSLINFGVYLCDRQMRRVIPIKFCMFTTLVCLFCVHVIIVLVVDTQILNEQECIVSTQDGKAVVCIGGKFHCLNDPESKISNNSRLYYQAGSKVRVTTYKPRTYLGITYERLPTVENSQSSP